MHRVIGMTQSITIQRSGAAREAKTVVQSGPHVAGTIWIGGWLFTIGFCKLVWWKALLGLVVWPYFLGVMLAR